ncbi:serine/threonine-protein kinase [Nannocystis pusilla]|uniref:serine/threonine-protein kinase n=1 Tax=Nannocystis pusilla TaxID=889268 RepID=UPI003B773AFE
MVEADYTGVLLDGRYRVQARLGQGGMGTVYVAQHVGLAQPRAIKFLRVDIARKPGAVQRFLQEARVLSAMRHDNLVGVIDMGEHDGSAYYVMELLAGEDLRRRLRRLGGIGWPQTRAIALQVCAALRLTHARGVVHRDLKPENCFCVDAEGGAVHIKLLDFGVAKVPREAGGASQLTGAGELLGTIGYMAPEQLEGQGDRRADIYSLGAMMFEMLAGRPLHTGNAYEILARMLLAPAPALASVCAVDPAIDRLLATAVARDPDARFASMDAFAAAIAEIPSRPNRRRSTARPPRSRGPRARPPPAARLSPRTCQSLPYLARRTYYHWVCASRSTPAASMPPPPRRSSPFGPRIPGTYAPADDSSATSASVPADSSSAVPAPVPADSSSTVPAPVPRPAPLPSMRLPPGQRLCSSHTCPHGQLPHLSGTCPHGQLPHISGTCPPASSSATRAAEAPAPAHSSAALSPSRVARGLAVALLAAVIAWQVWPVDKGSAPPPPATSPPAAAATGPAPAASPDADAPVPATSLSEDPPVPAASPEDSSVPPAPAPSPSAGAPAPSASPEDSPASPAPSTSPALPLTHLSPQPAPVPATSRPAPVKPPRDASAPSVRPLAREALRGRLERELASCGSPYVAEEIAVRVTPGEAGKLAGLAVLADARLAPGTVDCLERELARVLAGLVEGVDAARAFDVSLTLPRRGGVDRRERGRVLVGDGGAPRT